MGGTNRITGKTAGADKKEMRRASMAVDGGEAAAGAVREEKEFDESGLGIDRRSSVRFPRAETKGGKEEAAGNQNSRSSKIKKYKRQAAAEDEERKMGRGHHTGNRKTENDTPRRAGTDTQKKQRKEADTAFASTGGRHAGIPAATGREGVFRSAAGEAAGMAGKAAAEAVQGTFAAVRQQELADCADRDNQYAGNSLNAAADAQEFLSGAFRKAGCFLPETAVRNADTVYSQAKTGVRGVQEPDRKKPGQEGQNPEQMPADKNMQEFMVREVQAPEPACRMVRAGSGAAGKQHTGFAGAASGNPGPIQGSREAQLLLQKEASAPADRGRWEMVQFFSAENHVRTKLQASALQNGVCSDIQETAGKNSVLHQKQTGAQTNRQTSIQINEQISNEQILNQQTNSQIKKRIDKQTAEPETAIPPQSRMAIQKYRICTAVKNTAEKNNIRQFQTAEGNQPGRDSAVCKGTAEELLSAECAQEKQNAADGREKQEIKETAGDYTDVRPHTDPAAVRLLEEKYAASVPEWSSDLHPEETDLEREAEKNGILNGPDGPESGPKDLFSEMAQKAGIAGYEDIRDGLDTETAADRAKACRSNKIADQKHSRKNRRKKSRLQGVLSREKRILREKRRYAVNALTKPQDTDADTGSGAPEVRTAWERAGRPAAEFLAGTVRAALQKTAGFFLLLCGPLFLLFAGLFLLPGIFSPLFSEAAAVGDRDGAYLADSSYVYNMAKEKYAGFHAVIQGYEDNPDNTVTYYGMNSCIYDIVWVYMTLMENDGFTDSDILLVDTPEEQAYLDAAFAALYHYAVRQEQDESGVYYQVAVYEKSYETWFGENAAAGSLNADAQDLHDMILELLEEDDYAFMRNNSAGIVAGPIFSGDIVQTIWNVCKDNDFTDAGAAGLLGNLINESLADPTKYTGDPRKPLGIAQWLDPAWPAPGRRTALINYAAGAGLAADGYDAQIRFLFYELSQPSYSRVADVCRDQGMRNNWQYCCDYFADYYENCPGVTPTSAVSTVSGRELQGLASRRASAQQIYENAAVYNAVWAQGSVGSDQEYGNPSGQTGNDVAAFALQFVGNPYVWGGTSLTQGADCSGFVMSVYAQFGYSLPHSSAALAGCGRGVSYAQAQPGDLICYSGHVAIYIGNGMIVGAQSTRTGITTQRAAYREIIAVRRIIN